MILTKNDTFLPAGAMNNQGTLKSLFAKYIGLPIQVTQYIVGKDAITKAIITGIDGSAGKYWVEIINLNPEFHRNKKVTAFQNDWSDIKINFRDGIKEVRIGKDVQLTKKEARYSIKILFGDK